jgi:hypothetical protein
VSADAVNPARRARRWWPRTLYGRLLGVLLIGLVAGQGLSLWINLAERDRVVQRSTGLQPARRVADLVLLLDTLDAAERQRFVRLMDAPPLRVRLLEAPEPLPAPGRPPPPARRPRWRSTARACARGWATSVPSSWRPGR